MQGYVMSSNPYEFSDGSVDYGELIAVNKILDKIRNRNDKLADELSRKSFSSAYLQQVLAYMSPPIPKISFTLPPKEAEINERIRTLEEIIVINFNKRQTTEVIAHFAIYSQEGSKSIDIGMTTLRSLESIFHTQGRTIPEMEALSYLQGIFLQSIPKIRYKQELIAFLRDLSASLNQGEEKTSKRFGKNNIALRIVDRLIELCEAT